MRIGFTQSINLKEVTVTELKTTEAAEAAGTGESPGAAVPETATADAKVTPVGVAVGAGRQRVSLRRVLPHRVADAGMTTAEYAVGTLAACGFAGLLLKVLTSAGMATLLRHLVERALAVAG